jgi:hypothetical protein
MASADWYCRGRAGDSPDDYASKSMVDSALGAEDILITDRQELEGKIPPRTPDSCTSLKGSVESGAGLFVDLDDFVKSENERRWAGLLALHRRRTIFPATTPKCPSYPIRLTDTER